MRKGLLTLLAAIIAISASAQKNKVKIETDHGTITKYFSIATNHYTLAIFAE